MKLFFGFVLFCSLNAYAQKNNNAENAGVIKGKVVDDNTKAAIEYATITVYPQGSTKPINGIITDKKGSFAVDRLPFGNYTVVAEFVGYDSYKMDSVVIAPGQATVTLATITLSNSSKTLENVTVTASTPTIENKIDKIVYNADKDITSQGGVATDVLKKVPQVSVDVDGNVELQGSSSIRFLINGKPSTLFGNSVADALQSIPASQIQSIEVITSPGAKYDAQGTGGIINIILKKSRVRGMNGNINLSAGTRLENGSVNLNYRHNDFGINAYFSGNEQIRSTTLNYLNRSSIDTLNHTTTGFLQNGTSDFIRNGYHAGLGFDWSITKKDNITGSVGYHNFTNNDQGITYQNTVATDFSGNKLSDTNSIRNATNNFNAHSIDWSLNYRKTFKRDKQELDISYNSSHNINNSYYSQAQNYYSSSPFSGSNSNNGGIINSMEFAIDYTHPVSDNFIIETGVKNVQDKISSIADVYTLNASTKNYFLDPSQSYSLDYKRNVYAYYLSSTFSLFHFLDVKLGGRYEYTTTTADYSNAHNVNIPSYSIFAPSFVLSHSFTPSQSLKLSYTHRIERPEYRDLNPFVNLSDPHNISTGNPNLRPEVGHNFELGYNHSFEKGSNINVSLIYRINTDDITSYTLFYPFYQVGDSVYKDVSLTMRQNINSEQRYGVNLSGSLAINDKLTLRSNFFAFDQVVKSSLNGGSRTSAYGYRANVNGTYLVNKNLAFELFGNFRSKENNVQGTQTAFISYNIAMRKFFLNKKLSIGLTATNPFNEYVTMTRETFGPNFHQVSTRKIPFRSFGINLVYKFGKLEFKKSKEEDPNNVPAPF